MIPRQVTITIERSSGQVKFVFDVREGMARAMTIGISRRGAQDALWWLVPDSLIPLPFTVSSRISEGGAALQDEELSVGGQGSWLDQEMDPAFATPTLNRPIREIVYGEVPEGFQQAVPRGRGPAPLEHGAVYTIRVVGEYCGEMSFKG